MRDFDHWHVLSRFHLDPKTVTTFVFLGHALLPGIFAYAAARMLIPSTASGLEPAPWPNLYWLSMACLAILNLLHVLAAYFQAEGVVEEGKVVHVGQQRLLVVAKERLVLL